jgi:uncharacterized membrane protein YfcA
MSVALVQAALRVAAGLPIGLQLGATGTGGAILAVPVLVYVAGMPPKEAAAMSLVIVAASAWLGVWEYGRLGLVKPKAALAFSSTGILGSWAGAYGHELVRGEILLILLGLFLLIARYAMMRQSPARPTQDPESSCALRFSRACWTKLAGLGVLVGLLNGFFGVGGGFMIVPALTLFAGFMPRQAVGTSLCIIAIISLGGIARHLQIGTLDGQVTGLVIAGSAAGLLLGVRLGQALPPRTMTRITASITVGIALALIIANTLKILNAKV